MGGAAIGRRMTSGFPDLFGEMTRGKPRREGLAVGRAGFVGGFHRSSQRERIECAAVLAERGKKAEAEGDQSAACRRRRIERDSGVPVLPIKRLAPLDAIARKIVMGQIAA